LIYFDYSATTPPDKNVLDQYLEDNLKYFANPNSIHELGLSSNKAIEDASKSILDIFNLKNHDIIYTSGATESNNLAIKGAALAKEKLGKHLITTHFEHSSVTACFNYLTTLGFQVDLVNFDNFGLVDINHLEQLITDNTTLISIGLVNSETGVVQDLSTLSKLIRKYPNITFHSDVTQAIGKIPLDLSKVDLASFSAHKFYGLKGIGALIKQKSLYLKPVLHGGKSTTIFRPGTPATPLILSLEYALVKAIDNLNKNLKQVQTIHDYLLNKLTEINNVSLNSNKYSLYQIVNISFLNIPANKLQLELSKRKIFVSTQTACASGTSESATIKKLTNSSQRAQTAIRISLSHKTTKEEIDILIENIKQVIGL
jgi:cysteine desulfurase